MKHDANNEDDRLFNEVLDVQAAMDDAAEAYLELLKPDPARQAQRDALLVQVNALLGRFDRVASALRAAGQTVPDILSPEAERVIRALRENRSGLPCTDLPNDCSRN